MIQKQLPVYRPSTCRQSGNAGFRQGDGLGLASGGVGHLHRESVDHGIAGEAGLGIGHLDTDGVAFSEIDQRGAVGARPRVVGQEFDLAVN